MSLVGYRAPTGTVQFKGGSFDVKGLSLEDVAVLVQSNKQNIEQLWSLFDRNIGASADFSVEAIAGELVANAPNFTRTAIALAAVEEADFEEKLSAATRLTMPVQIEALKTLGSLTFEEVGGVKKFLESLTFLRGAIKAPTAQAADQKTAP